MASEPRLATLAHYCEDLFRRQAHVRQIRHGDRLDHLGEQRRDDPPSPLACVEAPRVLALRQLLPLRAVPRLRPLPPAEPLRRRMPRPSRPLPLQVLIRRRAAISAPSVA